VSQSNEFAIKVEGVSKTFKLPHEKHTSLKSAALSKLSQNKGYVLQQALTDISFEVKKGEFFGIVGRNGGGKSTLLKCIAGVYTPNKGKIHIKGKLVPFIELGVGFNPELTGRDNVFLNGALLGFSRKQMEELYEEIVEFAELEDFMDQKLKNYSSGMQVRLAFSIAIRAKGDVLLLDEVLAVGDAAFQRKCFSYFNDLKEEGRTIILVTHNMSAAREFCDRGMLVENGLIKEHGEIEKVADAYLRLFNTNSNASDGNAQNRWGTGQVKFGALNFSQKSNKVILELSLKSKEDLKNLVIGIDFYDEKNRIIGGIDNEVQRKNKLNITKGETKFLRFDFDNIFGGGSYWATVSVRSSTGGDIYDFWRKAGRFTNNTDTDRYFPVILPVHIKTIAK
jgi:ABC-2 type transport system ATP-binding protein